MLRFVRPDGSAGRHHPLRVLRDDGATVLGWQPAGTPIVDTRLAGGRRMRDVPLEQRFRLPRVSVVDQWRGTGTLRLVPGTAWSSVWWCFGEDGAFREWYVNLEVPAGRTARGPDRIDGVLDLVVDPDRTWRWKDEDEAEEAVRAGRLTPAWLDRLRAEGHRIIGLVEAGVFPFDGTWTDFRPDPAWPAPTLPPDLLAELGLGS